MKESSLGSNRVKYCIETHIGHGIFEKPCMILNDFLGLVSADIYIAIITNYIFLPNVFDLQTR